MKSSGGRAELGYRARAAMVRGTKRAMFQLMVLSAARSCAPFPADQCTRQTARGPVTGGNARSRARLRFALQVRCHARVSGLGDPRVSDVAEQPSLSAARGHSPRRSVASHPLLWVHGLRGPGLVGRAVGRPPSYLRGGFSAGSSAAGHAEPYAPAAHASDGSFPSRHISDIRFIFIPAS